MGLSESSSYVFRVCGTYGTRGGHGESQEEGMFRVGERVAEGKREFWGGNWEGRTGGGRRRYEILLFGSRSEVDVEEGDMEKREDIDVEGLVGYIEASVVSKDRAWRE